MAKYKPNTNDPRIRRRLVKAIALANLHLWRNYARPISKEHIERWIGRSNEQLGNWLRNKTLLLANGYYNPLTGQAKTYRRNELGIKHLIELLGKKNETNVIQEWASQHYQQELGTGLFEYEEKAERWHHPLQRLPREARQQILAGNGFLHDYDIRSAAATLIHQTATLHGLQPQPTFTQLLHDTAATRRQLASELGITADQVKQLLNALLFGASIGVPHTYIHNGQIHTKTYKIHDILDNDDSKTLQVRQHPWIQRYRQDCRTVWRYLRIQDLLHNDTRSKRIKPRVKAGTYFALERRIALHIRHYLDITHNTYLWQHDGWTSRHECDIQSIQNYIHTRTGYNIQIQVK